MSISNGEYTTQLLDQFDVDSADDMYFRALAEEYLARIDENPSGEQELQEVYYLRMGIIPSNNLHLWFNDRPIDPENDFSGLNNINNPRFESWPGVQGLLMIREQEPELFGSIKQLGKESSRLTKLAFDVALGRIKYDETAQKELYIQGLVIGWKCDLAISRVIRMLQNTGVSNGALHDLYR